MGGGDPSTDVHQRESKRAHGLSSLITFLDTYNFSTKHPGISAALKLDLTCTQKNARWEKERLTLTEGNNCLT